MFLNHSTDCKREIGQDNFFDGIRRRILLSHSITIQSTHSTVAGCQKRQMSITLATLTNKTQTHTHTHTHTEREREREREITYEHKTTKKERKDSEITQYDCGAGVSNTISYQDTVTK